MTIGMKKDHILRCTDLGMDFYRSCVCSACTEEEIDLLNKDEEFQKEIKERYALQEYNFLMKHNVALEIAKNKGNSKPIEWRLGILNPKKYGPKIDIKSESFVGVTSFDVDLDPKEEAAYKKRIKDMFGNDFIN